MDRRLGLRLQGCRVRATAGHGVVSTGAQTPGLLGFQHPETTPPSIPTTPRTAPHQCPSERKGEGVPIPSLHVPSHLPRHPQTAAKVRVFSLTASGFTAETDWLL